MIEQWPVLRTTRINQNSQQHKRKKKFLKKNLQVNQFQWISTNCLQKKRISFMPTIRRDMRKFTVKLTNSIVNCTSYSEHCIDVFRLSKWNWCERENEGTQRRTYTHKMTMRFCGHEIEHKIKSILCRRARVCRPFINHKLFYRQLIQNDFQIIWYAFVSCFIYIHKFIYFFFSFASSISILSFFNVIVEFYGRQDFAAAQNRERHSSN